MTEEENEKENRDKENFQASKLTLTPMLVLAEEVANSFWVIFHSTALLPCFSWLRRSRTQFEKSTKTSVEENWYVGKFGRKKWPPSRPSHLPLTLTEKVLNVLWKNAKSLGWKKPLTLEAPTKIFDLFQNPLIYPSTTLRLRPRNRKKQMKIFFYSSNKA